MNISAVTDALSSHIPSPLPRVLEITLREYNPQSARLLVPLWIPALIIVAARIERQDRAVHLFSRAARFLFLVSTCWHASRSLGSRGLSGLIPRNLNEETRYETLVRDELTKHSLLSFTKSSTNGFVFSVEEERLLRGLPQFNSRSRSSSLSASIGRFSCEMQIANVDR